MWQSGTTEATDTAPDLLSKWVQIATSEHVSVATPNLAGSGYAVGDTVKYGTGDGATLFEALFEVVAINGSNQPTALRIINNGAFADRVATVSINAAGTGYLASSTTIVRLTGDDATEQGTATQQCKISVTVNGSGVPTAVAVIEGGGAYTTAPNPLTGVKTDTVGPNGHTGTGLTVDITMVTVPSTTGVSLTTVTGSGTGATADLTLTPTGWSCNEDDSNKGRDRHDFDDTFTKTDNKEVVLTGTVAGGNAPIVGFRTYTRTQDADTFRGIMLCAMDTHNASTGFTTQLNFGPRAGGPTTAEGSYLPLYEQAAPFWVSITGRRIGPVITKATAPSLATIYLADYDGLLAPFGGTVEIPYPLAVCGNVAGSLTDPDDGAPFVSGISEFFKDSGASGPCYYRRQSDATWQQIFNGSGTIMGSLNANQARVVYPGGKTQNVTSGLDFIVNDGNFTMFDHVIPADGGSARDVIKPIPDTGGDQFLLIPMTLCLAIKDTTEDGVFGELENVYWLSSRKSDDTDLSPEDTISIGTGAAKRVFRVFATGARRDVYSFFCCEEGV